MFDTALRGIINTFRASASPSSSLYPAASTSSDQPGRKNTNPRHRTIIYTAYTTIRGFLIITPWLVHLAIADILLSILLPLSWVFPTAAYDISSAIAGSVWAGIQFIFTRVNGAEISFSYGDGDEIQFQGFTNTSNTSDSIERNTSNTQDVSSTGADTAKPSSSGIDSSNSTTHYRNSNRAKDSKQDHGSKFGPDNLDTHKAHFTPTLLPAHESAIVIANHISWTDFYMVQALAAQAGMLSRCRWFAKRQLRWVPFLGWGLWAMGMPLVSRRWMDDQREMERVFRGIRKHAWPIWLISFSESTRFTPAKHAATVEWCRATGRPVPGPYTLYPRTKGFVSTVQHLRRTAPHVKAVYDLTIAYADVAGTPDSGMAAEASASGHGSPMSVFATEMVSMESSSGSDISTLDSATSSTVSSAFTSSSTFTHSPSTSSSTPTPPASSASSASSTSPTPTATTASSTSSTPPNAPSPPRTTSSSPSPTKATTTTRFMSPPNIWQTLSHPHLHHSRRFHVHVQRHALDSLPDTDADLAKWLERQWMKKSRRLEALKGVMC